ncbi:restriction endonuclease subunit S [Halobacteriota archaeon]
MIRPIGEVTKLIDRKIEVQPDVTYRQIGVRVWGKGSYERELIKGSDTKYKRFSKVKKGDIIVNKIWARNGSVAVVPLELDGCHASTEFPLYEINTDELDPLWFEWITKQSFFWKKCEDKSGGTSGKNRIKPKAFLEIRIPIPDIETQKKLLKDITFTDDHIKTISQSMKITYEQILELRQVILQEAMQGKLVPQDPNDEPASALLEKIKKEKEKLIKEKKIKKEKPMPPIPEEEMPYQLPKGWEWLRLGELGETQTGTTPSTKNSEFFNGDIPFIKPADISDKGINYRNESLTLEGLKHGRLISENSLMMVCIGGSTGKSFYTDRDCSCNQQINTIKGLQNISAKFIYYFTTSQYFQAEVWKKSTGSATNIINKLKWASILFPLPPLNEQKRIVQKVDQLMKLCDELEEQVKENQKNSELLMEAVLREAFDSSH